MLKRVVILQYKGTEGYLVIAVQDIRSSTIEYLYIPLGLDLGNVSEIWRCRQCISIT